MSYCRFSTDDFHSDVYVYEDVSGGWTTHVASKRWTMPERLYPPHIPFTEYHYADYLDRQTEVDKLLKKHGDRIPIGLQFDGETFNDPTPQDCANRLKELKTLGYIIPDGVIDALEKEELCDYCGSRILSGCKCECKGNKDGKDDQH